MTGSAWERAGRRTALRPLLAFLCALLLFGQIANAIHLTRMSGVGIGAACNVAHHDRHAPAEHDEAAGCCIICAFASGERLLAATLGASTLATSSHARPLRIAAFGARDVFPLRPPAGWASSWSAQAPPASL